MQTYIVTYDLRGQNKKYEELYKRLQSFPDSCRLNNSSWLISSNYSCYQICKILMDVTDANDSIFVMRASIESAWYNVDSPDYKVKQMLNH